MTDDWYVWKGQNAVGPLSEKQLRSALATGRIKADTPVRQGRAGAWNSARRALAADNAQDVPTLPETDQLRRTWLPRTIVAVVGLAVVLAGGLWFAFELGRREAAPAPAAAAPADTASKEIVSAAAPARPAIDAQAARRTKPAQPAAKSSPSTVEPVPVRPNPATKVARVVGDDAAPQPARGVESLSSAPHNGVAATGQQKPATDSSHAPAPPARFESQKSPGPVAALGPIAAPPPVAVPKAAAKDADLRALETTARRSATAKEAAALYHHFQSTRMMPAAQEETFKSNLHVWEDRARQNLARLGDKWVAEAEAAKAHEEAAELFDQAYEMVKILNFPDARKTLEKASRVDPNSIAADFTLGILNSITSPSIRSPQTAARHFQIVLRRIPGYVPALNNLAIAEVRQEKYADAVRHLREAAERSPDSEEITQNLGRFVSEAQLGRIRPAKTVLSDATRLYSKVVTTKDGTRADLKQGWRFMPLVSPKGEREGLSRIQSPASEAVTLVGQGTGFVVEPHYVLTCRHVVDEFTLGLADKIELVDPADSKHQRRLKAVCVAVGQEDDLCLLRCDDLNVPSISLADKVPPRGTEILLMGFPGGSWFGMGLKTTRGVITALPGDVARMNGPKWGDFSRKLWYDAASSHGASGGAVCDEHGHVVAIHAVGYRPGDDPSNAKYAGGVPGPYALSFIRQSLPAFAGPPASGPALKWSEVDAKISPSIVLIVVGYRKVAMVMNGNAIAPVRDASNRESARDIYDDHVCSACNGKGRIRCRAPGCVRGGIHDEVIVNDSINLGTARRSRVVMNTTTQSVRQTCPTCQGTGYVRCPYCNGGYDPMLN